MITPITNTLYIDTYKYLNNAKNNINFNARIGVPINMEKNIKKLARERDERGK